MTLDRLSAWDQLNRPSPADGPAGPDQADALEPLRPISDDELTALALAADPGGEVPADAVPLRSVGTFGMLGRSSGAGGSPELGGLSGSGESGGLLPDWYMPSPTGGPRHHAGWQRKVAYVLIATFLAIDAAGLCSTYGWLTIA